MRTALGRTGESRKKGRGKGEERWNGLGMGGYAEGKFKTVGWL